MEEAARNAKDNNLLVGDSPKLPQGAGTGEKQTNEVARKIAMEEAAKKATTNNLPNTDSPKLPQGAALGEETSNEVARKIADRAGSQTFAPSPAISTGWRDLAGPGICIPAPKRSILGHYSPIPEAIGA